MTFVNMFANPYMFNFQPVTYPLLLGQFGGGYFPFFNLRHNNLGFCNYYPNNYYSNGYYSNNYSTNIFRYLNNSVMNYRPNYSYGNFNYNQYNYSNRYMTRYNLTNPFTNHSNFFEDDDLESSRRTNQRSNASSRADKAVEIAERELAKGVSENLGKNDGTEIRKYKKGAKNNLPWCGFFTSYCYGEGQGSTNRRTFGYTGSSQEMKRLAKDHYAEKNTGYTPKKGDLAIWTYSASSGHVGIVSKVYADGSFDVIQGNSSNKVRKIHYNSQNSVGRSFNGFVKMSEWLA